MNRSLVDSLWGEAAPMNAPTTLQTLTVTIQGSFCSDGAGIRYPNT